MKKLLFVIFSFIFIGSVNAKEYKINDMTVRVDESFWNVYTKDNLEGVSEDIKDEFKRDDTCLYAKSKMNDYEFTIASRDIDTVTNLNNLNDDDKKSFLNGFETEFKKYFDDYELKNYKSGWFINDYSYINVSFDVQGIYLNLYTTIVNGKQYDIIYYNNDSTKYENIDFEVEIIEQTYFDVDESMEEVMFTPKVILKALFEKYFKYVLWIAGPIIIGIICTIYKKNKDKKELESQNKEFWS